MVKIDNVHVSIIFLENVSRILRHNLSSLHVQKTDPFIESLNKYVWNMHEKNIYFIPYVPHVEHPST